MTRIKYGNLVTPMKSTINVTLYDKLLMEVK
jgi:hypothetical protein